MVNYPERDNENWLCCIIARQYGDEIKWDKKPISIDEYRVTPIKY
jgi:hypothetical protein